MADSLGNLSMDDMKWLGEPVDVAGSFQKGMNLSGQYQKMKQSGEMHPLRKEAARADIAYKTGQTSLAKQREGQLDKMNPLLVTQQQTTNAIKEQERIKSEDANAFWGTVKGHATSLYKSKAGAAETGAELAAGTLQANKDRAKAEARSAVSAARVAVGTEGAKTKTMIAQASILENRAELDSYSLIHNKTRADLALYSAWNGLEREGQDLQRGWLGLKEIRKDIEKDAASDFDFQVDYGAMNTFARNGDVDGLETHELGSNLSDAQRKTLESHRTQLQGQHAIETQKLIQQRGDVGQLLSDNKAMGNIQKVENDVHRQWFLNQNSQSQSGAAIYDPSTGKLTNDGLVALTNYTQYKATTLTADELVEIQNDLGLKGVNPGYDAVVGGDQFIPSKEMLNAMAVKTSANLTAERARFGANRSAEWKTQSGMTIKGEAVSKMDADVFKAELTHITARVNKLLEEGDMTPTEALAQAKAEADVVGGKILAIEGAKDMREKLKSGAAAPGDLYLDMPTGSWKHIPDSVGTGGTGGTGGAPGSTWHPPLNSSGLPSVAPQGSSMNNASWNQTINKMASVGMTQEEADAVLKFADSGGHWKVGGSVSDNLAAVKGELSEQSVALNYEVYDSALLTEYYGGSTIKKGWTSIVSGDAASKAYAALSPFFDDTANWPDKLGSKKLDKSPAAIQETIGHLKRWKGHQDAMGIINKALK
jgi:hypothetical protein